MSDYYGEYLQLQRNYQELAEAYSELSRAYLELAQLHSTPVIKFDDGAPLRFEDEAAKNTT